MNDRNDTGCRRRMLIFSALIVFFFAGVLFGMVPSAAETEHDSREVFVGDATIGITWEDRGSTYPAYGILSGLVSLADGEARLSPDLKSLTVVDASAAQADDDEATLPWEAAAPLLARALAFRDDVGPVLPGGEMDVIGGFGENLLFVPPALITSARLASAGSFDAWAKRRSVRRKLYAAAALRAVTLQEARRFDEMLNDDLAALQSGAVTMLGATNYAASSGLDVYTQLRIISGKQAAVTHGVSTAQVAAKVTHRVSASTLGKSVQALGVLAFAVDLAEGTSESRARQRLLAAAAADALSIASLEDARRLLEGVNADPAMTEGLSDAIGQLTGVSQTRLEEYAETAGDAIAGSLPSLAGAVVGYLGTGGAALVVREAAELGKELIGYSKEVLTVSAMATLGIALHGRIEALVAGEEIGGSAADAYAMRELVTLHDRLGAEATAAVYNMLWTDRWRNASSLAGIAKGAGLALAEWLTADADTEEAYAQETEMRVRRVRENAAFSAALPQILGDLQARYVGPPVESADAVTASDTVGRSGEIEAADSSSLAPGETFRDCRECPEMVVVQPGKFRMGSPPWEDGRSKSEHPAHRVNIQSAIAIGKYEVSWAEYRRFEEATGSTQKRDECIHIISGRIGGLAGTLRKWGFEGNIPNTSWIRTFDFELTEKSPVVCVSWYDTQSYVNWLSRETGKIYRLLSESEWEYVTRSGSSTSRYWGDDVLSQCEYGNGADKAVEWKFERWKSQSDWTVAPCRDGFLHTAPVGQFKANQFGLFDTLGNASEWVEDCWTQNYVGVPHDGTAWANADCTERVVRGGNWLSDPKNLRSASRASQPAGYRSTLIGFRIARSL